MDREELAAEVRRLRGEGYTPSEMARKLGVRRAEVADLVRMIAAERSAEQADEQTRCWVSPGWEGRLRVEDKPEWPRGSEEDELPEGVAHVLVARPARSGKLAVCGYLVDTWCLGVKNALGPRKMDEHQLTAFREAFFTPWDSAGVEAPLELGRHLVLGAVEYARSLGLAPHPDFKRAQIALGAWEGPSAIGFGREGVPTYVQGPYDDAGEIISVLEGSVGQGNFHFIVAMDIGEGRAEAA